MKLPTRRPLQRNPIVVIPPVPSYAPRKSPLEKNSTPRWFFEIFRFRRIGKCTGVKRHNTLVLYLNVQKLPCYRNCNTDVHLWIRHIDFIACFVIDLLHFLPISVETHISMAYGVYESFFKAQMDTVPKFGRAG